MRRIGAALMVSAFALLVVACGQPREVGFGGAPQATSTTAESSPPTGAELGHPEPPPDAQLVPAPKVDASALPEGYPKVAWTEGDGSTVGAYGVASGGCVEVRGELAGQDDQKVTLNIIEHTTSTGACTMEIRYPPVAVKLNGPLGDRTVVLQRTAIS